MAQAQSTPTVAPVPKFEAASIKPCRPDDGVGGGRGNGGGQSLSTSPGRLHISCANVWFLVRIAYMEDNPPVNSTREDPQLVRGGPAWAHAARFTIEAETDDPVANGPTGPGTPATSLMGGGMLRELLEDRFRLKIRRETEVIPTYSLVPAKGGGRLHNTAEGDRTHRRPLEAEPAVRR